MPYWEDIDPDPRVLPARAYHLPPARSQSLDGVWDFAFGHRADGSDLRPAGEIEVPGCWQLQGFGLPAYTNVRYPIPLLPPTVPLDNPTGEYSRTVRVPEGWSVRPGDRLVLRFDGVDSCARVQIDGTEVGIVRGSRLPTEFDVTDRLLGGDGTPRPAVLSVRVHQWSAGTYVEDQDMWWLSGIFRPVHLLHRPAGAVTDFFVRAGYDPATGRGELAVDCDVRCRLVLAELGIDAAVPADGRTVAVAAGTVQPWSPDRPRLYRAVLRPDGLGPDDAVTLDVGFRDVRVADGVIRLNGRRLVVRGVNRHEWHPRRGRTLTVDDMRRDLEICKRHNINAIRTSHYPPDPRLLDLADGIGILVMDECDLETHGFVVAGDPARNVPAGGTLAASPPVNPVADPTWRQALLARMRAMVERDKNHPCVVAWSLGNECGAGENLAAMARWARERDPGRLLSYEGDHDSRDVDIYSHMYLPVADTELIGRGAEPVPDDPDADRHRRGLPYLHIEYAHAMGNGPGGLAEYQDLVRRWPRLHGGFIWEWMDHGVAVDGDGRPVGRGTGAGEPVGYAYGGDFGEEVHDSNFVIDGLLFPDRTCSPAMAGVAAAFAPAEIRVGERDVTVENLYYDGDPGDLSLRWERVDGGRPGAAGTAGPAAVRGALPFAPPEPGAAVTVPLPREVTAPAVDGVVTVSLVLENRGWAPGGHELAWGQRALTGTGTGMGASTGTGPGRGAAPPAGEHRVDVGDDGRPARIGGIDLLAWSVDLWRPPVDNDRTFGRRGIETHWRAAGLDRLRAVPRSVERSAGRVAVVDALTATGVPASAEAVTAIADERDHTDVSVVLTTPPSWDFPLPRFGLTFCLDAVLDRLTYWGEGPGEGYPDTRFGNRIGRFCLTGGELQTPYVFPQENGMRSGVTWAYLDCHTPDGRERSLLIGATAAQPEFGISVHPYAPAVIDRARHRRDLVPDGHTWVTVTFASRGVGSAACGPDVLPAYELRGHRFTGSFRLG